VYAVTAPGLYVFGDDFYQHFMGGPTSTSINPALIPLFPSLAYDSWVTIGREDMNANTLLDVGIDWSAFEAGGPLISSGS